MKLSARTEYACIAVLELARRYEAGEPVRIREIAGAHGIPPRFLVQILIQLKGAGYVASTRGAAGGYRLLKPPEQITLGDVIDVVEGKDNGHFSLAGRSPTALVLLRAWREAPPANANSCRRSHSPNWPTKPPRRPRGCTISSALSKLGFGIRELGPSRQFRGRFERPIPIVSYDKALAQSASEGDHTSPKRKRGS